MRTTKAFKIKLKAFFITFGGLGFNQTKKKYLGRWEPELNILLIDFRQPRKIPDNFIKFSIFQQTYILQHIYNIVCQSETLYFFIESDDNTLKINGNNLKRKKGGVFLHYKEKFPVIECDDVCTSENCFATETCSQN